LYKAGDTIDVPTLRAEDFGLSGDEYRFAGWKTSETDDPEIGKAYRTITYIAKWEKVATHYGIWVGGISVTDLNADDVLGDADGAAATVTYDPDIRTLTFWDDYTYEGEGRAYKDSSGAQYYGVLAIKEINGTQVYIEIAEGATVTLKNTVTPGENVYSCGIATERTAYIMGSGKLVLEGNSFASMYSIYTSASEFNILLDLTGHEKLVQTGEITVSMKDTVKTLYKNADASDAEPVVKETTTVYVRSSDEYKRLITTPIQQ